jgi:N6-adenosine-specific RNA methylase IME4
VFNLAGALVASVLSTPIRNNSGKQAAYFNTVKGLLKMPITFHPLADIFPLIEGAEYDELVADIKAHGVREPIWFYEDQILDGRNRYLASGDADRNCPSRVYKGNDPLGFVISLNLKRRHLDESQRAVVAAKIANLKLGDNQHRKEGPPIGGGSVSAADAAKMLNVGKRSVERAKQVIDDGTAELQQAVERGDVSVSAAADVASLPQEEQADIVARGEKEILKAAVAIRARKNEERVAAKAEALTEISRNSIALPTGRQYPVLMADPPWRYDTDAFGDVGRSVRDKYPTMPTADICALPVESLATPDAVLFMWAVYPMLPEALEVLRAWGFKYVAGFVWVKDKIGMGSWVRAQHEHLLIARRGAMYCPLPANRPPSIIEAPRREHSRKPDEAYELIERMYPELPKIELFARQARDGWSAWGNQAPAIAEAA